MEGIYILCILISACAHALYNYLMHSSGGSRLFLLFMFLIAACTSGIALLFSQQTIHIPFTHCITIYAASLFYVLYQISVSKAYEKGEISRLYPLTVLSPIFVPIWAFLFLQETISGGVLIGIIITILGAISVKQKQKSYTNIRYFFSKQNSYKGAGIAILASIFYSFGAVFDKASIEHFELLPYLAVLLTCMAVNMLIINIILNKNIFSHVRTIRAIPVLAAGLIAYISFYTFRVALQHVDVSIAVPIRVSSVLFAVILGLTFGKELISRNKIIGIITIISGILIINFTV
ncbi:MAG: EamA family transporter [Bacteroidales bacterium]|jgi:drug/metabolite transporter (DMT)-like permease|nr:EamA family transporter [Bacteroidales bacterium]